MSSTRSIASSAPGAWRSFSAWAAFLAFAWYTTAYPQPGKPGRLGIINPSYRWLSLASAAALILVGAALLPAQREEHAHHPRRRPRRPKTDRRCSEAAGIRSAGELVFQALFLAPDCPLLVHHRQRTQRGQPLAAGRP